MGYVAALSFGFDAVNTFVKYADFGFKVRRVIDEAKGTEDIDFSPLFDEFAELDESLRDIRQAWEEVYDLIENLATENLVRDVVRDFAALQADARTIFDLIEASEEEDGKDFGLQEKSIDLFNRLESISDAYIGGDVSRIIPPSALVSVVLPTIQFATAARIAGQAEDSKSGLESAVFREDMRAAIELVAEILYDYAPRALEEHTTSVADAVTSEQARSETYYPPGPNYGAKPSYAVRMEVDGPFGETALRVWASSPFTGTLPSSQFSELAGEKVTDRGSWRSLTEDTARGVAERERSGFIKEGFDRLLLPFEASIVTYRELAGSAADSLDPAILHGDDTIVADEDRAAIEGRAGDDYLVAPRGNLDGGTGNDTLIAEDGFAEGHHGDDRLVRVRRGEGGDGDDTMSGAEYADLFGGDGDDVIFGGSYESNLEGGAGNDRIRGFEGYDYMSGGPGNDTLVGAAGRDWLDGGAGDDTLKGGSDADDLDGGAGDDAIVGGGGNDTIRGADGDDRIAGNAGDDRIDGGDGADLVRAGDGADQLFGGAGHDVIFGGDGDDVLEGGEDHDMLLGGKGADHIDGGAGNDTLKGGGGNDVVIGGDGQDYLVGQGGADDFMFLRDFGDDRIADFEPGVDRIVFDTSATGPSDLDITEHPRGFVFISSDDGTLRLWNVSLAEFSTDDLVF